MAFGFLKTFAQRIAQPFVDLSVRLKRTVAQTMQTIGRAGIDIEASVMREQIRRTREIREQSERIAGMTPGRIIDPLTIPEAITRQRRQFAWVVRTRFLDSNTGQVSTRFTTISTDRLMSPEEVLAEAEQILAADYAIRATTIVETDIERVTRAGAAGTL